MNMNTTDTRLSGGEPRATNETGSFFTYAAGFLASVILTLVAFQLVQADALPKEALVPILIGLALSQIALQLFLFLHLGSRSASRWQLPAFVLMLIILCIIVIGSLWTMQNLDTNMMPATSADWTAFLSQQE